jgi:hypothetical protein
MMRESVSALLWLQGCRRIAMHSLPAVGAWAEDSQLRSIVRVR